MTKNEIKAAIENAAAGIGNGEGIYVESVSAAMKLDPEYAGVIVEKRDDEIVVYVDNGECYPATYGVDEFANVYGDDAKSDAAETVDFDELKSAFVDFADEKTPEFAARLIDEYFPNAKNREKLIEELLVG